MGENDYGSLFDRICHKCSQRNCYGSDNDYAWMNSSSVWMGSREESAEEYYYDNDGNKHNVSRQEQVQQHQRREQRHAVLSKRFAYSPATEAQLHATEEALGFLLPGILRALYAQVANGGFGPSSGITGAKGGFPDFGEDEGEDIADVYHKRKKYLQFVGLRLYEGQLAAEKKLHLPWGMFPAFFLLLCDDGCGMKTYIDANTGRIFQEYIHSSKYWGISLKAHSLEEWLEAWLIEQ